MVNEFYGELLENITLALSNKIDKGYLSKQEGIVIAKRMLYDNAKEFFRL